MEPLHVRRVEQLFESLHPYLNSTDMKWTVCIPGAEELVIAFDSQTRTEQSYDWLLLTNADSTTTYGRYSGTSRSTWPGAEDGSAPLVVPGDSCSLHFHSDGSNTGRNCSIRQYQCFRTCAQIGDSSSLLLAR